MIPSLFEMKNLSLGMHSGVRPACPHRIYRMMKNFLQGRSDMILYRFPIRLRLPS